MPNLSYIKRIQAFALIAMIAGATMWKGIHFWVDAHKEVIHCHADGHLPHFHDERYAPDECFACAFVLSPFESLNHEPIVSYRFNRGVSKIFSVKSIFLTHTFTPFLKRGPPFLSFS